jgi:hypothetical protein
MSFREKSAWITVVAILIVSLIVAAAVPRPWSLTPAPGRMIFFVLHQAVVAFVMIEVVAHVAVAGWAPRDAKAPFDERDRLIALKARSLAFYVFTVLVFGSVLLIHLGANGIGVGYSVLVSFVVAQAVNYAARIFYYRRGV